MSGKHSIETSRWTDKLIAVAPDEAESWQLMLCLRISFTEIGGSNRRSFDFIWRKNALNSTQDDHMFVPDGRLKSQVRSSSKNLSLERFRVLHSASLHGMARSFFP